MTPRNSHNPHVVNETARCPCKKTRFLAIANTPAFQRRRRPQGRPLASTGHLPPRRSGVACLGVVGDLSNSAFLPGVRLPLRGAQRPVTAAGRTLAGIGASDAAAEVLTVAGRFLSLAAARRLPTPQVGRRAQLDRPQLDCRPRPLPRTRLRGRVGLPLTGGAERPVTTRRRSRVAHPLCVELASFGRSPSSQLLVSRPVCAFAPAPLASPARGRFPAPEPVSSWAHIVPGARTGPSTTPTWCTTPRDRGGHTCPATLCLSEKALLQVKMGVKATRRPWSLTPDFLAFRPENGTAHTARALSEDRAEPDQKAAPGTRGRRALTKRAHSRARRSPQTGHTSGEAGTPRACTPHRHGHWRAQCPIGGTSRW